MKSEEFAGYKKLADEKLLLFMPKISEKASALRESMEYSLMAGGKRVRPVLMLAACELAGGSARFALPFAVAAEYIHTYSLIHDDLPAMDNDDYRRGKLTNHKVFGEAAAILAGDGLLSAAYEIISSDMAASLNDPEALARKTLAFRALAAGTGVRGMVAGQVLDLKSEHEKADGETLEFIHKNKTAAFIEAVLVAGAHLGGADAKLLEALSLYGRNIGLAFQIADDIQDVIGDPEKRGKKIGGDEQNRKATYPALYGLDEAKRKCRALIRKARSAISEYRSPVLEDLADYLETQVE